MFTLWKIRLCRSDALREVEKRYHEAYMRVIEAMEEFNRVQDELKQLKH